MKLNLKHETKLNSSSGTGGFVPQTPRHRVSLLWADALLPSALAALGCNATFQKKHSTPRQLMCFAVISDPHLYDRHLGDSGQAFEDYLNQDPKLLRESEAILEAAIESIVQQRMSFVIVYGDITKGGELQDHVLMTRHIARLEQRGIQIFVVPGNHDINNPDAVAYGGDMNRPFSGITPRLFRGLYDRFGYGQAIALTSWRELKTRRDASES